MRAVIFLAAIFSASLFPQGVAYTFTSNGVSTLSHNGQSYAGASMAFVSYNGVFDSTSVTYSTTAKSVQAEGFTHRYNSGIPGDTSYVITLSGTGTDVFNFQTCITNNDTLGRAMTSGGATTFAVTFPSAETWTGEISSIYIGWPVSSAVALASWATGTMAMYASSYEDALSHIYNQANDSFSVLLVSAAPLDNTIAAGATKCTTMHLKWGGTSETISTLGEAGYDTWHTQHPVILNYPNRNPFAFLSIGDDTNTATNPRGWRTHNVATPDFLGAGFAAARTGLLAKISLHLTNAALQVPRVQTIMIWDIEGQEFGHTMTYVGGAGNDVAGSLYPALAPEMEVTTNGVPMIDSVFTTVRDAGFKVGVTLRPARFSHGSGAPISKCYNKLLGIGDGDFYIRTDASWPDRGYLCATAPTTFDDPTDTVSCSGGGCSAYYNGAVITFYPGTGSTLPTAITTGTSYYICNANTGAFTFQVGTDAGCGTLVTDFSGAVGSTNTGEFWRGPTASGQQGLADDYADALNILRSKINYYRTRWGIDTFYVDTSKYCVNAPVCRTNLTMHAKQWQTLYTEYPTVLFLPENSAPDGYTGRFNNFINSDYGMSAATRRLWPTGFVVPYTASNVTRYTDNRAYIQGQLQQGVPYMIESTPGTVSLDRTYLAEDYALAAAVNGIVSMTNSATGQPRTFKGAPGTSFAYQLTMRVYFASTSGGLAASTTYCTRKATDSCYLSGTLQATAALDLSALTYYSYRYYDFAGNLVSNPGNYALLQ